VLVAVLVVGLAAGANLKFKFWLEQITKTTSTPLHLHLAQ
jgi:hypothetical protein